MLRAILFDLDDTLLGNDMDAFLRGYFPLLSEHVQPFMSQERFLAELMAGTQAMIASTDSGISNQDVFWLEFTANTGLAREALEPVIDEFYTEKFGRLQSLTRRCPSAARIVSDCFARGLKVVIATNPLFPRSAIEQRLEWAGLAVTEFKFDLVTTYENMHAAKPNVAYYRQILEVIGVEPSDALMVGDDWENDMVPASRLGLWTYWVTSAKGKLPSAEIRLDGQGTLEELGECLSSGWLLT